MKIGFHYHVPAEKRDDGIYMPSYLGRFIDGIAERVELVRCFMHSPMISEVESLDYRLENKNIEIIDLGARSSVPKRILGFHRYRKLFRSNSSGIDIMLFRGPTPMIAIVADAFGLIPVAFLLVGSYINGVGDLVQPTWRMSLIRIWTAFYEWRQKSALKNRLVFVNSQQLFDELKEFPCELHLTRTTTLNENDIYERQDTCQGKEIRILYTGRFDLAKGLAEMIQAMAILHKEGHNVSLDMVGWEDSRNGVIKSLKTLASDLGVSDRLTFHGRKSVGEALFRHYRESDIYVIGSKSNEGFPRTIWEAMANSLPVVATSVGSIPAYVGDAALIAKPGDIDSLTDNIRKLIKRPELRKILISKGIDLAKGNTNQQRSLEMVESIQNWLNRKTNENQ